MSDESEEIGDLNKDTERLNELRSPSETGETGEVIDETEINRSGRRRRTKSRVKVKTRIRVKKKSTSSKHYKKLIERVVWIAFIAAFVAALVVLYQQLGINDAKYKSNKRTMLIPEKKQNQLIEIQCLNKQISTLIVASI